MSDIDLITQCKAAAVTARAANRASDAELFDRCAVEFKSDAELFDRCAVELKRGVDLLKEASGFISRLLKKNEEMRLWSKKEVIALKAAQDAIGKRLPADHSGLPPID